MPPPRRTLIDHRPGRSDSTTRPATQPSAPSRSVSVRNYGDPIAADPPGGWGGGGRGKPDRTVWPTARRSVAGTPVPTYDDGFPKAPPPRPPSPRCSRSDRGLEGRGARARPEESACPQPSDDRLECGRDRRSIPRASFDARLRGPSAAGRAGETGGPWETRRSTSCQAYRFPTFRRTARRSDRVSEGPPVSPARRTDSQGSNSDTTHARDRVGLRWVHASW